MALEVGVGIVVAGVALLIIGIILIGIGSTMWKSGLKKGGIVTTVVSVLLIGGLMIYGYTATITYEVYTVEDFLALDTKLDEQKFSFKTSDTATIELKADLDFTGVEFKTMKICNLKGNGHSLKNITMNVYKDTEYRGEVENVGIFTYTTSGNGFQISDLKVENLNLSYYGQNACVGGLFGNFFDGKMSNVYVSGTVEADNAVGVGGLVGELFHSAVIENCTSEVNVFGKKNVGGIAGTTPGWSSSVKESANIENCKNLGTVTGEESVGGIFGGVKNVGEYIAYVVIEDCENGGKVDGGSDVGGIVGYCKAGVSDCVNSGEVTGGFNTGGIVGYIDKEGSIMDCTNEATGKVVATGDKVGGIVGYCEAGVVGCENKGTVSGSYDVGGIIGHLKNNLTISTCISSGTVTGTARVGGIIGRFGSEDLRTSLKSFFGANDITVMNCKVSGTLTCNDIGGGIIGLIVNDTVDGDYLDTNVFDGNLTVGGSASTALWTVQLEE